MHSVRDRFSSFRRETTLLFRNIPAPTLCFFVLSVVAMNLLANKSIDLPVSWLALDAGFLLSWVAFLAMDVIVKHFGVRAANQVAVFASLLNLFMCFIFFLVEVIPGAWSESFVDGSEDIINNAIDKTFGGQWYVILGSTAAFLSSALINNFLSWGIGKAVKSDAPWVFFLRAYVSTSVAQFVDNLIFAFLVSYFFFGWSVLQVFTCALTGMVAELLMEVIFSPIGYHVSKSWKRDGVGETYFAYMNGRKGANA